MALRRAMTALGAAVVVALGVSACGATGAEPAEGGSEEAAAGDTDWSDCTPGEESAEVDLAAVSEGDIDFLMDNWLPVTHEDYTAQFGDDMEA